MLKPQQADIFLIPLMDGGFGVGQVVEVDATPEGSALCLLTRLLSAPDWPPTPIHDSEAISLVLVTDDALRNGTWQTVGFEMLPKLERVFPLKNTIIDKFHGIAVHEPAIIEAFVNACHGLYPWDGFPDPTFFNSLLVYPDKTPSKAKMKRDFA